MINKTEVLTFEDALNNHKKVLNESLVNFDEGHRVRKILLDVDSNSADYEYYFQCGQQSKKDEIDELQKRVDRAVEHIEDYYGVVGLSMIVDILKGEEAK